MILFWLLATLFCQFSLIMNEALNLDPEAVLAWALTIWALHKLGLEIRERVRREVPN